MFFGEALADLLAKLSDKDRRIVRKMLRWRSGNPERSVLGDASPFSRCQARRVLAMIREMI